MHPEKQTEVHVLVARISFLCRHFCATEQTCLSSKSELFANGDKRSDGTVEIRSVTRSFCLTLTDIERIVFRFASELLIPIRLEKL